VAKIFKVKDSEDRVEQKNKMRNKMDLTQRLLIVQTLCMVLICLKVFNIL
jgi:hypothetical protein